MELTTITVRYGLTFNLGNYSNIKPEVELTATLAPNDDPKAVKAFLTTVARTMVEEEIDQALERQGDPALFSAEPRYQLLSSRHRAPPVLALVPAAITVPAGFVPSTAGLRLSHAVRVAQGRLDEDPRLAYLDLRDGDLSALAAPDAGPATDEVPF